MSRPRVVLLAALIAILTFSLFPSFTAVAQNGDGEETCQQVVDTLLGRLVGDWSVDWRYRTEPDRYLETTARVTWTPDLLGCSLKEAFSGTIEGAPFAAIAMVTINPDGSFGRMTVDSQHGGFNLSTGTAFGDSLVFDWSRDLGNRTMRTRHVYHLPEEGMPSFEFFLSRSSDTPWELVEEGAYRRTVGETPEDVLTATPKDVFWNTHSGRFIYAPAFDFPVHQDVDLYRFTVKSLTDGAAYVFYSSEPTASLAPIWQDVPVDSLLLLVEGYVGANLVPVAERRLIKSPGFAFEPMDESASTAKSNRSRTYSDAGLRSLDSLYRSPRIQHWTEVGGPNPEYPLWVYPSKVMGATIRAMAAYSRLVDDEDRSNKAAITAQMIADFMLNLKESEDSPLAGWPPVHWRGVEPENHPVYEGEFMVQFPAEAGLAVLDLFDLTGHSKYLDAAKAIADRYAATQREDGTWYLLLMAETGEPGRRKNPVVPTYMIELYDRLHDQYGLDDYLSSRDRAVQWIMENPVATFAWEAQFEDTRPKPSLQNLAYRPAAYTAKLLFKNPETVETAALILRFVEDQFIVWYPSDPMLFRNWFSAKNSKWNGNDPETGKDWFLPSVLEQYAFYTPIAGAAATLVDVYVTGYRATGNQEYLAKARAIAGSIMAAQAYRAGGEIPTHMRRTLPEKNWTNVGVHAALKLIEHADILGGASVD